MASKRRQSISSMQFPSRRCRRNEPATMTSLASFTKEKLQTARSNVVHAIVYYQIPQSTGQGAQQEIYPHHHHHHHQQHLWESSRTRLRSGCRTLLCNRGLSICERNLPHVLATDETPTQQTIIFCATAFKCLVLLKVYGLE